MTGIDVSAKARGLGITTSFVDLTGGRAVALPQRVVILAQGATSAESSYTLDKAQITSATQANVYGRRSQIAAIARTLFPVGGQSIGSIPVTVLPLKAASGAVAASGKAVAAGTATAQCTFQPRIGGLLGRSFTLAVGAAAAAAAAALNTALAASLDLPVTAAVGTDETAAECTLTCAWKGPSGNSIEIEILGPTDCGITWTITDMASGAGDPDVAAALAVLGTAKWDTMIVNGPGKTTDALAALAAEGERRWGTHVHAPFVALVGETAASQSTACTVTDARPTDRVNAQIAAPDSPTAPWIIAADAAKAIARLANSNPPHDYGGLELTAVVPGDDSAEWNYPTRDAAAKAGSGTTSIRDGVVVLGDVLTMYHPSDEEPPAYSYVCDVVKVANVIYNAKRRMQAYDGRPLVADATPVSNPTALKPKMVRADFASMSKGLASAAVLADADYSNEASTFDISSTNPKRLDVVYRVRISGNANVLNLELGFGFYFGTPATA